MRSRPLWLAVWGAGLASGVALGCAGGTPSATLSPADRFEWALERFEAGKHQTAIQAFRQFIIQDPLNPLVDSAQFLIGESFLRSGQELEAVTEFEQLTRLRPNSPHADDAQFGLCRAHWKLSPGLAKEQEHTRLAMDACTRLIQFFSDSPLVPEANRLLQEAQAKLAAKSLRIANYYFRRKIYESANIYLEKALGEAPADAPIVPQILERLHESYRRVGFDAEAETVRQRLLREWPESPEAEALRERAATARR